MKPEVRILDANLKHALPVCCCPRHFMLRLTEHEVKICRSKSCPHLAFDSTPAALRVLEGKP